MAKRRVLLVEDHALVAQGLRALLEQKYEVVELVQDGNKVVPAVKRLRPDVLLLDLSLPNRNGMDLIPEIRAACPRTRILVVTMHADPTLVKSAFGLGALGFVPKDCDSLELHKAIGVVLKGRYYRSKRIPARERQPDGGGPALEAYWLLTPRQQEIVRGIAEGLSTEQIADRLGLSVHTIHFHRRGLRRALKIESEDGLARYAAMLQLGAPGSLS
jgi:DNA-binding NarL/FixJ family response regulator